MAITKAMAYQMMQQVKKYSLGGRVLQLGKQDIWMDQNELIRLARQLGFQLRDIGSITPIRSQFLQDRYVMTDEAFFSSLGYNEVFSLDITDFEGATVTHDLNRLPTPLDLLQRFDVIYDFGTIEHVFHLPNALANIHNMLRTDGYIVHGSPCSNAFEHGFYMFSPCFFFDYYRSNGYEILGSWLMRYRIDGSRQLTTCEVMECWPESRALKALSYIGSLDSKYYAINIMVRKNAGSTSNIVPQQGYYKGVWSRNEPGGGENQGLTSDNGSSVKRRIFNLVNSMPLLRIVARWLYGRWRRWNGLNWKRIPS